MNPIKLYLLSIENFKKYLSINKGKTESLIFNRVPIINKIRTPLLKRFIFRLCIVIEPILSLLIVTLQLPLYCINALVARRMPLSGDLYIESCPLLKERTIAAGIYEEAIDWLYLINANKSDLNSSKRCHSIFEYLSLWDVIKAYSLSVVSIVCLQSLLRFKYVMRTSNSFEFFLMYYYLQNISPDVTLYFCNQIDRWAVLFDRSPQKNRVLLQHGIEGPNADWPVKFEYTDTVYVLSMEEAENLFHAVFKVKPTIIHLLKPTIKLTKIGNDNNIKILIVGYPGYQLFDKELKILKAFHQDGYTVFLKPHPGKENITTYVNLEKYYSNCKIILGNVFPDVDVVCSYRSTLAVEYQAHSKFVMMYENYTVDEMIEKIQKEYFHRHHR